MLNNKTWATKPFLRSIKIGNRLADLDGTSVRLLWNTLAHAILKHISDMSNAKHIWHVSQMLTIYAFSILLITFLTVHLIKN